LKENLIFLKCSDNDGRVATLVATPAGVNFFNVKRARFLYECLFSSYFLALNELLYKKFARLTLMKLTAAVISKKDHGTLCRTRM